MKKIMILVAALGLLMACGGNSEKQTIEQKAIEYSEKALKALEEMAEFEGYKENASAEFAALRKKLSHDIDHDFTYFDHQIRELLADELVVRYYYQKGSIVQAIKSDSVLIRANRLLADKEGYEVILMPQ